MSVIDQTESLRRAWARCGGACGSLAIVAYALAAFAPLPDALGLLLAFAFGPLLGVGAMGLRVQLQAFGPRPVLDIAAAFAMAAGAMVLAMLSVQQALAVMVPADAVPGAMQAGLDAIHYGLDVAWDVLISAATSLFGIAMLRGSAALKALGTVGIVLGMLLLGFNLAAFPVPPAAQQSTDWGPFVALWLLSAFLWLLRRGMR